jgi:Cu/Zn superoxide dismutase
MRRLVVIALVALTCAAAVVSSATAHSDGRNPRSGVAIYELAGASGEGQVRGLAVVVQKGKTVHWWVSGSGLTPGAHAQHIHGPGDCEANAAIILPFSDVEVQADGTFFASGRMTTNLKIAAGRQSNYWNVHERSTADGAGPGVTCGERESVSR